MYVCVHIHCVSVVRGVLFVSMSECMLSVLVCFLACVCVCVCVCECARVCVCVCMCSHAHTCMDMYIKIYVVWGEMFVQM